MISVLITKMITFFIIMMAGFALVKTKIIRKEDAGGLARITLYLVIPCVVLRAFETEFTDTVRNGMIFSLCTAAGIHIFFFLLIPMMRKLLHFNEVETLSVIYPNAGNLAIPLVVVILGWNYVIYSSCYIMVQQFLIWSHGRVAMQRRRTFDWKKTFLNVNIIAVFVGVILLLIRYRFPVPVSDAMHSIADMVGPLTMLICGMLLSGTRLSAIATYRKWWMVVLLRLVIIPLILVPVFKYSGLAGLVNDGKNILAVTLVAVTTPPATTLTLMAEVYHGDAVYANLLNVASTLFFLLTLPLVMSCYL